MEKEIIKLEMIYSYLEKTDKEIYNEKETILIDGRDNHVFIEKIMANIHRSTRDYYVVDGVKELLEDINDISDKIGPGMEQPPADEPVGKYTLHIDYDNGEHRVISGIYNEADLPENWCEVTSRIIEFLNEQDSLTIMGDYGCPMRTLRENEIRLASVFFGDDDSQIYHYQDTVGVEPGDYVIVPVGKTNKETSAMVYNVGVYKKDETPIPLEKIKSIIRIDD